MCYLVNLASAKSLTKAVTTDKNIDSFIQQTDFVVYKSINKVVLKAASTHFNNIIKNPSDSFKIKKVHQNKIKDYKTIQNNVTKFASEIKKIQVSMQGDNLHINIQNQTLVISAMSLLGDSMIINGTNVIWNPQTDTFESLRHQITKLITIVPKTQTSFTFIPQAFAEDVSIYLYDVLATVLGVENVSRLQNFLDHKGTGFWPGNWLFTDEIRATIAEAEIMVKNSIQKCDEDLVRIQNFNEGDLVLATGVTFSSETLDLMKFMQRFNEENERLELLNCQYEHDGTARKTSDKRVRYINPLCNSLRLLSNCLKEHYRLVTFKTKPDVRIQNNARFNFEPANDSPYKPLMDAIKGNPVISK